MKYDYSVIEALQARARRERAQAVHRLLVTPVVRLLKHAVAPQCAPEHPRRAAGDLA